MAAGRAGAAVGREGAEGRPRPPLPPRERGIVKCRRCAIDNVDKSKFLRMLIGVEDNVSKEEETVSGRGNCLGVSPKIH